MYKIEAGLALVLLAGAVAAVVGCNGASEISIVGKWERNVDVTLEEGGTAMEHIALERMASTMKIDLYLRDDGTCTAWENGNATAGTWELDDRQVTLTFEQGARLRFGDGEPMRLVVSEDGKSMESVTSLTNTSLGYVFKKAG